MQIIRTLGAALAEMASFSFCLDFPAIALCAGEAASSICPVTPLSPTWDQAMRLRTAYTDRKKTMRFMNKFLQNDRYTLFGK